MIGKIRRIRCQSAVLPNILVELGGWQVSCGVCFSNRRSDLRACFGICAISSILRLFEMRGGVGQMSCASGIPAAQGALLKVAFQNITSGKIVFAERTCVRPDAGVWLGQQCGSGRMRPTYVLADVFLDAWHEGTSWCNVHRDTFHSRPLQACWKRHGRHLW